MRSMTGSGSGQASTARARVSVTASSVNHRFLDLQLRLPDGLSGVEPALREALTRRLMRGRVEIQVRVEGTENGASASLAVDREGLRALRAQLSDLAAEGLLDDSTLRAGDLFRFPQLLRLAGDAQTFGESEVNAVGTAVEKAADELAAAREAEGRRIGEAIAERLETFHALVDRVSSRRDELQAELVGNLQRRLATLLDGRAVPEDRLAVEVAILADRADVAEELDRLGAHLEHFRELMSSDGPVGKRLDFLCQELLREVNTLGSKCRDAATTREVLEAKQLCEQIREQVQNVE
jgi:uncharacterized protein (TIGR00255 family)